MNEPLGELSGSSYLPSYYIALTHPGVKASQFGCPSHLQFQLDRTIRLHDQQGLTHLASQA
jgi:hypothetical protein